SSTPEGLLIHARMVDFAPGFTTAFLLLTTLAAGPPALHFAEGIRTTLADAERRHLLQAWQLRQTVPDEALKDLDGGPAADAPARGEAT
ncbi:MAG: hypothetical protein IT373_30460, partial [Polyangiaceae bacterium]|nr:hypothetical protein [Polyangiaceae bacterium]